MYVNISIAYIIHDIHIACICTTAKFHEVVLNHEEWIGKVPESAMQGTVGKIGVVY